MEIRVRLPGFELQRVVIQSASLLSGPKLLVNGKRVPKSNGFLRPRDDNGAEIAMRFRHRFFDPIPNLEIGGNLMQLAPPLKWHQYAWMMLPILLVFIILLVNNRRLMGRHVNKLGFNIIAWATVVVITILIVLLLLSTIFNITL